MREKERCIGYGRSIRDSRRAKGVLHHSRCFRQVGGLQCDVLSSSLLTPHVLPANFCVVNKDVIVSSPSYHQRQVALVLGLCATIIMGKSSLCHLQQYHKSMDYKVEHKKKESIKNLVYMNVLYGPG